MEQDPSDPRQDRGQDQTHQTENPTEDQAEDGYVPTRTVEGQQEGGPRGPDIGMFNTQQHIRTPARTGSVSATGSPQSVETSPTSVVPNMLTGSPLQDTTNRLEHSDEGESNTETLLELATTNRAINHSEVDHKKHLTTTSLSHPQFQYESPQDYFYNDHYEESNQSGETVLTNSCPPAACEPPPTHGMGAVQPSSLEGSKSSLSELKSSDTDREIYLY